MGGGYHPAAHLMDILQYGDRQGGALRRVRSGPQLVEEHQALGRHVPKNADDIGHMAGEGGQVLLNALFIPDVRIDGIEDAQLAAVLRRHEQPGHGHQA
ncbi:hypothetical protein D3C75_641160 [compost metagenome]